jgi:hypothetical protein
MAKMRGFKPETWTDEKIVSVSPLARLLVLGMWNYACDNGHVDDSPVQMKMRILPADNCDPAALVVELINVGLLVRKDGYLKVPNLPKHQNIDRRYLVFCDHCTQDTHLHFQPADKLARSTGKKGHSESDPSGARGVHDGHTEGARDEVKGSEGEVVDRDSVSSSPKPTREEEHRVEDEPRGGAANIRSVILAREYTDRVKLCDRNKVSAVVFGAMQAAYEERDIRRGLRTLAKESRPVTPDTLRIAIEGMPVAAKPASPGGIVRPANGQRGREGW